MPDEKEYSLKPIEIGFVNVLQETTQQQMFNYLCTVAIERLGLAPTKRTQFRVDGGKVFISEKPEPDTAVDEPTVDTGDTNTSQAIKQD